MEWDPQQLIFTAGRWLARGALAFAAITFLLQWLLPRFRKWYRLHGGHSRKNKLPDESEAEREERRKRQESLRQELQDKHRTKAESYKERILLPREEAKKRQKEEEYYKFMGPAWKGKGQALGIDEDQREEQEELDEFEEELSPREMAAVRRRIQKPTPQPPQPPQKPKRVVTLPDEPSEADEDSVLVILRSPIQTVYQRRFRKSDTVQTLLDFMTVSGFTQSYNTLCTSYPRYDLGKDKEATLVQLGFVRRVTLNIEELDLG